MRQQIIGTGIAEHPARRFAHRRARRGGDVGFLYLFGHDAHLFNRCVVPALVDYFVRNLFFTGFSNKS
jgi:hypothetical protein